MYFTKIVSTLFLGAFLLGANGSSFIHAMDLEKDPSEKAVSKSLASRDPLETFPSNSNAVEQVLASHDLVSHICSFLKPADRKRMAEVCSLYAQDMENFRRNKLLSFSMREIQVGEEEHLDAFLQRYEACKNLEISNLNWNFLSASFKRITARNPEFKFHSLESLSVTANWIDMDSNMYQDMKKIFLSMTPKLIKFSLRKANSDFRITLFL